DNDTKQVFALAELTGGAHVLFGIDASTGAVRLRRAAEPPKGDRIAHQQRAALTLLAGRVYVAYGGLYGDCGTYFGSVVSVPTTLTWARCRRSSPARGCMPTASAAPDMRCASTTWVGSAVRYHRRRCAMRTAVPRSSRTRCTCRAPTARRRSRSTAPVTSRRV